MRHIWIRNYRSISQCVEQTADRVHRVADPTLGPAVVQNRGLLIGPTTNAAPGTASAVPAVRPLRIPIPRRAATAHVSAAQAATTATGHWATRRAGRWMIVIVGTIAVAPRCGAQIGTRSVRECSAPVTGTARATTGVTGPRVIVTAPRQAASGRRGRHGGGGRRRRRRRTATGRRSGQTIVTTATATYHWTRHTAGRTRARLRISVVRTRLRGTELVAPGRWV